MPTNDLANQAEQVMKDIYNQVNNELALANDKPDLLGIIQQYLPNWQKLSREQGFNLVGIEVYLPRELENAQRNNLKHEFTKQGFKYENLGEELINDQSVANTNKLANFNPNSAAKSGVVVTPHPELDMRGMPLEKFYLEEDKLQNQATLQATKQTRNTKDATNDYQLSLRFSPKMEGPKLKDRAVYKPGEKPPAPTPRIDFRIRPF
jgi:hypothetical protein